MRQTFFYASTDCQRIVLPPPSHNLKWLFFRLFPHNSYLRVRSNNLLNEGNILINNDDIAMTETLSKNDVFSAKFARICRNWFICSSAMLILPQVRKICNFGLDHKILSLKTKKMMVGRWGIWTAPEPSTKYSRGSRRGPSTTEVFFYIILLSAGVWRKD